MPEKGERDERPAPAPSARRIRDKAAVANAPANTAAQETPDAADSVRLGAYESYATVATPVDIAGTAGSVAKARVGALMIHLDMEVGPVTCVGKPCYGDLAYGNIRFTTERFREVAGF